MESEYGDRVEGGHQEVADQNGLLYDGGEEDQEGGRGQQELGEEQVREEGTGGDGGEEGVPTVEETASAIAASAAAEDGGEGLSPLRKKRKVAYLSHVPLNPVPPPPRQPIVVSQTVHAKDATALKPSPPDDRDNGRGLTSKKCARENGVEKDAPLKKEQAKEEREATLLAPEGEGRDSTNTCQDTSDHRPTVPPSVPSLVPLSVQPTIVLPTIVPHAVFEAQWACHCCRRTHGSDQPNNALAPFRKRCGFFTNAVAKDGDCFYTAVCQATRNFARPARISAEDGEQLTVKALRHEVAARASLEQLHHYQICAEAK
jgi:hypothetical protein